MINEKNQNFVDFSHRNGRCFLVKKKRASTVFELVDKTFLDDQQMETSIRNVRSLGVIPRAKIKTVKMTLVIVIGQSRKTNRFKKKNFHRFIFQFSPPVGRPIFF